MKIIEINRSRNRLILSERQAMQEQRESVRSRLLRELEPGQVSLGRVSSICDFGAFVDIGGADGLIHLSEISWKRVAHPQRRAEGRRSSSTSTFCRSTPTSARSPSLSRGRSLSRGPRSPRITGWARSCAAPSPS